MNIDWNQLNINSTSRELSFESFCYQIACKKYNQLGNFAFYYNTPGSEFYLELKNSCKELSLQKGDVVGWQAKFWFNQKDMENSLLDKKHRDELIHGFIDTISYQPNLKCWIICTPGKFSNTKPHCSWDKLICELNSIKKDVEIVHWHKDSFETIYHENPEGYSGIYNHYFNTKFIGIELLNRVTTRNLKILESKFDVDLHIKDEQEVELFSSIFYEKALKEISEQIKILKHAIKDIKNDRMYSFNSFSDLSNIFVQNVKKFVETHFSFCDNLSCVQSTDPREILLFAKNIISLIEDFRSKIREPLRRSINKELKQLNKKIDYHDKEWINFTINSTNHIYDLIVGNESNISLLHLANRALANNINIFAAAGYGKTHCACSIAYQMKEKGLPVLLLLGSTFRDDRTPQQRILELIEVSNEYSYKDLIAAINNLGCIYRCKIPVIIDGLNESYPYCSKIWNNEIYSLINDFNELENIILITTCRDKSEYIQKIFDKRYYSEVENHLFIKGFSEQNINHAISKYFDKYKITHSNQFDGSIFSFPLILKLFCEVNSNKENVIVSQFTITQSIEKYVELLIEKISTKDKCVDKKIKLKLNDGLQKLGDKLWSDGTREILFSEFIKLFSQDELDFKLVDEGMCFQRDIDKDRELVQFTYDLVGGYQIAKSVFFVDLNIDKIIHKITELQDTLFCDDKSQRHPLHEDIIKSITYLLPHTTGKQIYEIIPDESILVENVRNIDLLCFDTDQKEKLIKFIDSIVLSALSTKTLLQELWNNASLHNRYDFFDIITPIILKLNSFEIDCFWNEIIRREPYKTIDQLKKLEKFHSDYTAVIDSLLLYILLLTGTTDLKLRSEAVKSLLFIGKHYPYNILEIAQRYKNIQDEYIVEALICCLTGITLRLNNKSYTENVNRLIIKDFLIQNPTNNIAILDNIQTLISFAKARFDLQCDELILYRNQNEIWTYNDRIVSEIKKGGIWSYEMMDYDFIKYQVTALSNETYNSISKYSKAEIIMLLSEKVKEIGYSDIYNDIEQKLLENNKYRREEPSELVIKYSDKYLNIAYYNLAGYLMVNYQISPEYKNTFRFDEIFFDPTFPILPPKTQLINECFLPNYNEDIQDWILKDEDLLREIYQTIPLWEKDKMVLLFAFMEQKNDDKNTRIYIHINSYICYSKIKHRFNDYSSGNNHLFAGEILWRKIEPINDEIDEDYNTDYFSTTEKYAWSAWSSNRYQNPSFRYLNSIIAHDLGLDFDIDSLSYKDKSGNIVTKLYRTDNSTFLFVNKNILDDYLNNKKCYLKWDKIIQKYGEFGIYEDKKYNPSFREYIKTSIYKQ